MLNNLQHRDLLVESTDIGKLTTIKLSNQGLLVTCKSLEGLRFFLNYASINQKKFRILGWGANQVILNTDDIIFLKLELPLDKSIFKEARETYSIPASAPLNLMTATAIKLGLKGWEVFTGIPASFGGAICMNAGTSLGEIGELVEEVEIMQADGRLRVESIKPNSFSYRKNHFLKNGEVIVGATIGHRGIDKSVGAKIKDYLSYRKDTQPLGTRNCGSVFKNLDDLKAGKTIDLLGLKGVGGKQVAVSLKHGNFIENKSEGLPNHFFELITFLQEELERLTGRKFELEVKIY